MSFITIVIASAGMALGLSGPEHAHESKEAETKACCSTAADAAHECAMCEKSDTAEPCAMCADKAKTPAVDSALYGNAQWPAHNKGEGLYAKDLQGQTLPVALGTETWISKETKLEGKVVILDFWATWCPPCRSAMPILDKMQKENPENLAILAIGGQNENETTVREFVAEHKESIHNLFDADQSVYKAFESKGIPLVVVMSTDGVIRWIGNPHDTNFKPAVMQVLSVDPVIQAKS